jgi:hypothetical protein
MADITNLAELTGQTLDSLANSISNNRRALSELNSYGKIYTLFEQSDILVNQKKTLVENFWITDTFDLINIETSSIQNENTKKFYLETEISSSEYSISNLYLTESTVKTRQFSVFYGNRNGSGSLETDYFFPSIVTYKQFANKCLEPEDDVFTFGDGLNSDHIYGLLFNNEYIKDGISPNYFQLSLLELNGASYLNSEYTGSNVQYNTTGSILTLIPYIDNTSVLLSTNGNIYNLVSGSILNGIHTGSDGNLDYYGILYENLNLIILNANKLNTTLNFNTVTGSNIDGFNAYKLFKSIQGSVDINSGSSGVTSLNSPPINSFIVRRNNVKNINYYFAPVRSYEYNYSTNPSFITGSNGYLRYRSFSQNPTVYISSIGLYNDFNELLAVGKLSKPLIKQFGREYLIKIKLEF